MIISLGISGMLYACNGLPRNAQCIPIIYPSGEKSELGSYEFARYHFANSFDEVVDFYDENLEPIPTFQDWKAGGWQEEKIDDDQILYDCVASINAVEVERGCILVKKDENQTTTETIWYLSGDAGPLCDRDLSIVR